MSTTTSLAPEELKRRSREHQWLHMTRTATFAEEGVPIMAKGEGCYLEDVDGKRYLDALSGLASANLGYSFGEEIGEAVLEQMKTLPYYINWAYSHPPAIELTQTLTELSPEGLDRVFLVSGGSEAVETAWKMARQHHLLKGTRRWKAVARRTAWHGTTMGALSLNGVQAIKSAFEPLVPGVIHVRNTNRYRRPDGETEEEFTAFLLEDLESAIAQGGPETIAMVIMEPMQNGGGSFTPPAGYFKGVREICDRHGILLCADEVICAFGRLGEWFGSERYDIAPDIITCAKGLASCYGVIAGVLATERVMEPFLEGDNRFHHGLTYGGHPVQCLIASKTIEIFKRERVLEHVRENEANLKAALEQLTDLPIVGDLRGVGYHYGLELVKDKESKESFSPEEADFLIRGYIAPMMFERGLIARFDDREDPVIQISPPCVAGQAEFDFIGEVLGEVFAEAWKLWDSSGRRAP